MRFLLAEIPYKTYQNITGSTDKVKFSTPIDGDTLQTSKSRISKIRERKIEVRFSTPTNGDTLQTSIMNNVMRLVKVFSTPTNGDTLQTEH